LLSYQSLHDKAKREKGWECSTIWNRRELATGFWWGRQGRKSYAKMEE